MRKIYIVAALVIAGVLIIIGKNKFGCTFSKTKTVSQYITIRTHDGIQLAGTITKPSAISKAPLIVLIHGSGDDTRQNAYYKLLTGKFNESGFAVFTYDKRGSGSSTGSWIDVPFSYLKDDVLSIVKELEKDTSISKIGLWGGSEGSCIALWAASESKKIAFVIAQSFTSVSFAEQNKYQTHLSIKTITNNNIEDINSRMHVQDLVHKYALTGDGYDEYVSALNGLRHRSWFSTALGEPMSRGNKWWAWYKTKMNVVPIQFLLSVNIPVLFLWGESDELVPVNVSLDLVKERGKSKKIEYKVFKNANHSLYTTGIEPVHIDAMQEWMKRICKVG